MNLREVAQQALEALIEIREADIATGELKESFHVLIDNLRAALDEESTQEPVAWMSSKPLLMNFGYSLFSKTRGYGYYIPVYIALPKDKPPNEKSIPLIDWESLITKQACVRVLETVLGIKE